MDDKVVELDKEMFLCMMHALSYYGKYYKDQKQTHGLLEKLKGRVEADKIFPDEADAEATLVIVERCVAWLKAVDEREIVKEAPIPLLLMTPERVEALKYAIEFMEKYIWQMNPGLATKIEGKIGVLRGMLAENASFE